MTRKRSQDELHRLTSAIQTLNTRWARRALSLWQGLPLDGSPEQIYAGFEAVLTPETIAEVVQEVESVSAEDVRALAETLFSPDLLSTVILRPES